MRNSIILICTAIALAACSNGSADRLGGLGFDLLGLVLHAAVGL